MSSKTKKKPKPCLHEIVAERRSFFGSQEFHLHNVGMKYAGCCYCQGTIEIRWIRRSETVICKSCGVKLPNPFVEKSDRLSGHEFRDTWHENKQPDAAQ